ncbi:MULTISPECIES: ADP-forming succinate--CoA ligase subunit beta [unclassified Lebetimonas]|uniref:ADP-forming succinate--CoA ligase subunit beta n=1 Tax=unclassified Lebetimonas TaxID=2648158 RepID=UPI0004674EDD|nr:MULTISPECIES: ADP-forming succinate--CoA ligase subunit beta [unclassified Lebetimonas]
MNIHEYQAKEIFKKYGVPTPRGGVAFSGPEAKKVAQELGGNLWVVKAQIHAGGRGKAGGVKLAKSLDEVEKLAEEMIGMTLVTHQTGPEGKVVKKVYIEEGADIKAEYYLGMVLDRALEMPVMMASTEGGMEIEEVAAKTPEKIVKVSIDPTIGFQGFHARKLAFGLGLNKEEQKEFIKFAKALYNVYVDNDAEMIEINPLIKTGDNKFLALDAKMGFDDNALYRHPDIAEMRDLDEEEPTEIEAKKYGLSYIKLDGNVGCMVNGAGLAMATMDIIKHEGGEPANFLDVGGGANPDTVAKGFEIILSDPNVKSIFVNIFGGIVRCDRIANGILQATEKVEVNVPLVVRLDGTNAAEAAEILKNANIKNIIPASDLKDGAQKAVKAAKGEL